MKISLNKTLEELERENWGFAPPDSTTLVIIVHQLRKKPLKEFTVEDLRILIGQNFSLEYLVPLAITRLKENILAEGNCYEGDLLNNVLNSSIKFWEERKNYWLEVKELFERNRKLFESNNIYREIRKSFEKFEQINK